MIPLNTIASTCGNNICEDGESPASCTEDCRVEFDDIITCNFDDNKTCIYEETWFGSFLFVVIIIFLIYTFFKNRKHYGAKRM